MYIQNVVCTFQHSDNRLSDINFGVNKMLNPISFSVKLSYPQQEDIFIHTQNLPGNFFALYQIIHKREKNGVIFGVAQ